MSVRKAISYLSNPNLRKATTNRLKANTKHAIDSAIHQTVSIQDLIDLLKKYPKTSSGSIGALGGYSISELLNDEDNTEELSEDELLLEILANSK